MSPPVDLAELPPYDPIILHASAVAFEGRAVLITGPSGAGKSSLALGMMALGATLVSDDRTLVTRQGDTVIASAPDTLSGLIEARFIGILHAAPAGSTPVTLVVDLAASESDRLPPRRTTPILGVALPLVRSSQMPQLAAALVQYLKAGRQA